MKVLNIKYWAFLMISLGWFLFTACEEETMEGTDDVELLSFGPSGVKHGDEIIFIGSNLDQVASIVFKPEVEVAKDAFVKHSATDFKVVVPDAAEAGVVLLKTMAGDTIKSKSILNFEVPVDVASVTAEARPGANITISGDKINWIETVTFSSDLVVEKDEFVSQSLTELVVTVPMEAETGFLTFSTGGTEPLTFGTEDPLTVTLPSISALNPASIRHTEDLTIEGSDLDLVTEVVLTEGISIMKAEFKSQSESEIVLSVPATTVMGTITLKQLSPIDVVSTDELTIILPVGESISPSPLVPGTDQATITGTNLDLVDELLLPMHGSLKASEFVSHTATEIVFDVPGTADKGAIRYTTIHGYEDLLGVILKVPSTGGADVLDYYIYNDGLQNGWGEWDGWGHNGKDFANQEQVHTGDYAIKVEYNDQWGAVQIGSPSADVLSGYKYLSFKVYAAAAQDYIFQIGNYADSYLSIPAGWSTVDLLIADLDGKDDVGEIRFKNNNANLPTTIYIDEIGLRLGDPPPPPLDYVIYDDALQNGWGEWDGWGHDGKDFANQEQVQSGDNAIKVTYNDQWGAIQFGSPSADVFSGYSKLAFYVYAPAAQDFIVQIGNYGDTYLSIPAGWSQVQINIADMDGNTDVGELRLKNNNANLPVTIYIDQVGLYL